MGEIDKKQIVDILSKENPNAPICDISIYADFYIEYQEAKENLQKNGVIVMHPRTGAPIENPYRKVRDAAAMMLRKIKMRNVGDLWAD